MISRYLFGKIIDNCYHLYKISIREDLMNTRIGSLLIKHASKYIKELDLFCLYLEARASYDLAIRFYGKFGFKKINIRKNYSYRI